MVVRAMSTIFSSLVLAESPGAKVDRTKMIVKAQIRHD